MQTITILTFFIFAIFNIQCSAQKNPTNWRINDAKTNYVQKGILDTDYFKPPQYLIGKYIEVKDSIIILSKIRGLYDGYALDSEFGDTLYFEKKIYIQRREDDEKSINYPGDELTDCILQVSDTCHTSNHFMDLLGAKENNIAAYISMRGKRSKTRCILFILIENKEMILYSENDFLLLFLKKK